MPLATKEFVLNYTMNRWQLNFKRNVGPMSDTIRKCQPSTIDEWREYYYSNMRSKEHIDNLGEKLFYHVTNSIPEENRFHPDLLKTITHDDCIEYMHNVVIDRTYNGYAKERGG